MSYKRYAVYHCPDGLLGDFGAVWLGWDIRTGAAVPVPPERARIVHRPHRYGFHATLKAPFALTEDKSEAELLEALRSVAAGHAALSVQLELGRIGPFFALKLAEPSEALARLAAACVTDLDGFRAPESEEMSKARIRPGMSARQQDNLARWGYPYVLEDFRFHLTLTGRVMDDGVGEELAELLPDELSHRINSLCLCGEAEDGRFHLIERVAL